MTQRLIIVSGMYGSGKTTYCSTIKYPVIHIDDVYDYAAKIMHYDRIEKWKNENIQSDSLVLDAYMFGVDRDLSGLKKTILPILDIGIRMIYTTLDELYECMRSTPERRVRKKAQNYSREEDIRMMKHNQSELMDIFSEHLSKERVVSVEYIFREGGTCITKNKEHFLKTIGGRYVDGC